MLSIKASACCCCGWMKPVINPCVAIWCTKAMIIGCTDSCWNIEIAHTKGHDFLMFLRSGYLPCLLLLIWSCYCLIFYNVLWYAMHITSSSIQLQELRNWQEEWRSYSQHLALIMLMKIENVGLTMVHGFHSC